MQEEGTWKLQDESSVSYVPNAVIGFEAGEGDLKMGAIKVSISLRHEVVTLISAIHVQAAIKSTLDVSSYVLNKQGESTGYVVCQRGLSSEEFDKLVAAGDIVDGAVYTWRQLSGTKHNFIEEPLRVLTSAYRTEEEEKPLQLDYIKQSIVRMGDGPEGRLGARGGRAGRGRGGGRGGGRGRDGGKTGGRDNKRDRAAKPAVERENRVAEKAEKPEGMKVDPLAGTKRKRDAEPDGPEKGDRGAGPAVIKKVKVD